MFFSAGNVLDALQCLSDWHAMPKGWSCLPFLGAFSPPPLSSDSLTGLEAAVCHEAGVDVSSTEGKEGQC